MKKFLVLSSLFLVAMFNAGYLIPATTYAQQSNQTTLPTKEEQAVDNISNGLLPPQIKDAPAEESKNIIDLIKQQLSNLIGVLFNQPTNREKLYNNAQNLDQTSTPPELQPKNETNPLENFKQFLGGDTGLYGGGLPKLETPLNEVKDYEEAYECANFPCQEGIRPITPN